MTLGGKECNRILIFIFSVLYVGEIFDCNLNDEFSVSFKITKILDVCWRFSYHHN